jgi:hypothetical protein
MHTFSDRAIHKIIGLLLLFCTISWFIFNYFYGERVNAGNGLGWDGIKYAVWTTESTISILNHGLDLYFIQRLFPSTVIYYTTTFFNHPLSTTTQIINAFFIYNSILLALAVITFCGIAKHLKWDTKVFYIAVAAIFLNFPILKHWTYNPNITDLTAFSLGIFTIYFYLKEKKLGLFLVTIAASFTYPSMIYGALCLLLFKMNSSNQNTIRPETQTKINSIITGIFAAFLIVFIIFLYNFDTSSLKALSHAHKINDSLIIVSLISLFFYLYFIFKPLVDYKYAISSIKKISWQGLALSVILLILMKIIIPLFSDGKPGALTISSYLREILLASVANPLISVVSNIMYFGPGVLLIIFFWKEIVALAKEMSPGLVLYVILYVILAIGPESRQIINAWPVFVILACQILNKKNISWNFCYAFIILSLLVSRFYLPLNGNWTGNFLQFPDQKYFMNFGPWLSDTMYFIFLGISVLLAVFIYSSLIKTKSQNAFMDIPNLKIQKS